MQRNRMENGLFFKSRDIWFKNKLSTLNRFITNELAYDLFLHNGNYLVEEKNKKMRGR